jgi:hypothetical protein
VRRVELVGPGLAGRGGYHQTSLAEYAGVVVVVGDDAGVKEEYEAFATGAALAGSAEAPTATPVMMPTTASIRVQNLRMKCPSRPRNGLIL